MLIRRTLFVVASLALVTPVFAQKTWDKTKPLEDFKLKTGSSQTVSPILLGPSYNRSGSFVSQVNVGTDGNNIVGDAANEPSMTIDRNNPNRIAVGWRQFDSVNSNFREAGNGFSTDGGVNWVYRNEFTDGTFRSDPVLDCDSAGNFWYLSLKETFFCDLFKSTDGGSGYTIIGPAVGGDKQWFTIDKSGTASNGFMHQIWSTAGNNYNGRQYSRSTDNGVTWSNPINITNQPVWGVVTYGSNGAMHLNGTNFGNTFYYLRSSNANNAGVTPTFDLVRTVSMGGTLGDDSGLNPAGLPGQCWLDLDRSNGPRAGYIYYIAPIFRNASNPCDVMFNRSTNGGSTWGTATRVNDDANNSGNIHMFPSMSVSPDGRIDVFYFDTRDDAAKLKSHLRYTYSMNGGTNWAPSVPLTQEFDTTVGFPQQNKIGDYMQCVSFNSFVGLAFPTTLNGEQDVYYTRVNAPLRPLRVNINLDSYFPSGNGLPVQLEVRDLANNVVHSETRDLDQNQDTYISVPTSVADGTYFITAKVTHWLRARAAGNVTITNIGTTGLTTISLVNGDIDGNNIVTTDDYLRLSLAFDATPSDPEWDAMADLNGSGQVTTDDYLILSTSFDQQGYE